MLHGVVNAPQRMHLVVAARLVLLAGVALSLFCGIAGGLLRVGIVLPAAADAAWLGQAAVFHAALMICGFLGTVIGIERAVAVKLRIAFVAPLASGLAGVCLLLGQAAAGAWLAVLAAVAFTAVTALVVHRQRAAHTVLLLVAAAAWLVGNLLFATGIGRAAPLPWWFAFLVMTVAAERLEMTRLLRRSAEAGGLLFAVLALMLVGAAWFATSPAAGGLLFGLSLTLLAAWLGVFDIARRTVRAHGLSRYMAVSLLGGYVWLAVAGVAWMGMAFGLPWRDAALHALGLGFIVSMMMGHAPVILPAVARVKLSFSGFFYVPLLLLHVSLIVRLGFGGVDASDASARALGAALNAVAILVFIATLAGAALAWRLHHGAVRVSKGSA